MVFELYFKEKWWAKSAPGFAFCNYDTVDREFIMGPVVIPASSILNLLLCAAAVWEDCGFCLHYIIPYLSLLIIILFIYPF